MQTLSKFAFIGLLAAISTSALAQATSTPPTTPQTPPAAGMQGMMMQPGTGQAAPGAQAPSQQGGMMQGGMMGCPMMQRSAQMADAVKQLQQQVTEMRAMMEQMSKR